MIGSGGLDGRPESLVPQAPAVGIADQQPIARYLLRQGQSAIDCQCGLCCRQRPSLGELIGDHDMTAIPAFADNLAELQVYRGELGYRWDGEAWFGGDINRFTFKSEGGGNVREGVDAAEVQALYSRAIGPYFNLQVGVRQDLSAPLHQTYATFGFEGLAPYWFEVSGALFLSTRGNLLARLEGYYDQNITQRLILQPRVELNFAAQNIPEDAVGAGLTNAELGLRLRYEITREFAPYIGISYDTKVGQTATYASQEGRASSVLSFVAGVRVWF